MKIEEMKEKKKQRYHDSNYNTTNIIEKIPII